VAASAADVVVYLRGLGPGEAHSIGLAMRERALKGHTYALRAAQVHAILQASFAGTYLDSTAFPRIPPQRALPNTSDRGACPEPPERLV
jgi:hypothetical protein